GCQPGAVDPAGGLAQPGADLARLALQQIHLARRRFRLRGHTRDAAPRLQLRVDAPLLPEQRRIGARALPLVADELRYVETDPTGTDHRHLPAYRLALQDGVQITDDLRMIHTRNRRHPRHDAGSQNHFIEISQILCSNPRIQFQLDTRGLDPLAEIPQRLVELLLARHQLGHVELTADL